MFRPELAQAGDILLYRSNSLIGDTICFFTGSKYAHVALYIGNNRIIESHIKTGVVEKDLNSKWYNSTDIYRVKEGLSEEEIGKVIAWARSKIGCGYDIWAFPSTFIRGIIGKILNLVLFREAKPVLNFDELFFCYELIASAFYYSIGRHICPGVHVQSCTGNDIAFSPTILQVC